MNGPGSDAPGPVDLSLDDGTPGGPEPRRGWRRWLSPASLGTLLLLAIMVGAGIFAAVMVTPGPDEEALPRPSNADVVIAAAAPLSWDPAAISDSESAQLLSQVFEGLTVLDGGATLRPALAESWAVSEEGRRVVFTLREGLTFSDGSPLDADDVRRSWLRVLDPARANPLASLLDDVEGAAAYARGEGPAEAVGIQADGRTLSVHLARPASYFPAVAAVPSLAVVPESMDDLARGPRARRALRGVGRLRARGGRAGGALAARQPRLLGRPAAAGACQRADRSGRPQRSGRLRGRDRGLDADLAARCLLDPLRPDPRTAAAPVRRDGHRDARLRHDAATLRRRPCPACGGHGRGLAAPGRARPGGLGSHLDRAARRGGSW